MDHGAVLAWTLAGGAPGAQVDYLFSGVDYTFTADQFDVTKNGDSSWFNDDFNNGNPPPSGDVFPNGIQGTYSTSGTFGEAGGRLIMDDSGAGPTFAHLFTSIPYLGHFATLGTDISGDMDRGLKSNDDFTVTARFDLSAPDENGEAYGIRLSDFIPSGSSANPGDDVMELVVRQGGDGQLRVQFLERDFAAGTTTNYAAAFLNAPVGADQIELTLSHEAANVGVVTASFKYLDGGVPVGTHTFGVTGRIFGTETPGNTADDEVWTLAQIITYSPGEVLGTSIAGTYGTLAIQQNGQWHYDLDNGSALVQALAEGQTATETFTATVLDEHGASDSQTISVTVTGTNDGPVITNTAAALVGAVTEDLALTATGQLSASDVDNGATQAWSVQGAALGSYGAMAVDSNGQWTYTLDNAAHQNLARGESHNESFVVRVTDDQGAFEDQTVTVTITGTNDAPVIAGGPQAGAVQEDVTTQTVGQLLATDVDHGAVLAWTLAGGTGGAANYTFDSVDYTFTVDQLDISRNGSGYFSDAYADANPGVGGLFGGVIPGSYFTSGVFQEADGRLIMDDSGAGPTFAHLFTSIPYLGHFAAVATDISNNMSTGLKSDDDFTVAARFDLNAPDENGEAYGIRLTDFIPSGPSAHPGDDVMELVVRRGDDGLVRVQFLERDFAAGSATSYAAAVLNAPAGADQIVLKLSHQAANVGEVTASFDYLSGGAVVGSHTFGVTGQIFGTETPGDTSDDEVWTRAQIITYSPGEVVGTSIAGVYGALEIEQNGTWTYHLDNDSALVQALAEGQTATETFTATVLDEHGASDSQTISVTVTGTNDAPAITSAAQSGSVTEAINNSPDENSNVTHQATGTLEFTDVDLSDVHGVSVSGNATVGYRGTLSANVTNASTGDGSGAIGWTFAVADGALDDLAQGEILTQTYSVALSDGHGGTASQNVVITLTGAADNSPPVAVNDDLATNEDVPISFNVLGNDTDVDLQTLSIVNISALSNPALGTLQNLGGGQFSFAPVANASGTTSFTYQANDGQANSGNTATVNITVNAVNDAPVIGYTSPNLIVNGSFEQPGPGVITSAVPGGSTAITGWTVTGDSVDYISSGLWQPAEGTFSLDLDGDAQGGVQQSFTTAAGVQYTVTFEHAANLAFSGTNHLKVTSPAGSTDYAFNTAGHTNANMGWAPESFSFTATGSTSTLMFASSTAGASGPTLDNVKVVSNTIATNEDTAVAIGRLSVSDLDAGADAMQLTLALTHGGLTLASTAGLSGDLSGSDGTLSFTGSQAAINAALASGLAYAPTLNYIGADALTVSVNDQGHNPGGPLSATQSIALVVNAVNDAPVAVNDSVSTNEDAPLTISAASLLSNDTEFDLGDSKTLDSVGTAAHGTVALSGGNVIYTPAANYNGQDSFSYTMRDAAGLQSSATVSVTVDPVNDGPAVTLPSGGGGPWTLGNEFRVNTTTSSDQLYPDALVLRDGSFIAAWSDYGGYDPSWGVFAKHYDAAGNLMRDEFALNATTAGHQVFAKLAALPDGGFAAVWSGQGPGGQSDDVIVRRFDANGDPVTGEVFANQTFTNTQYAPAIAPLKSGGYVVTWDSAGQDNADGNWGVYGRVFDASGTAQGNEFRVNTFTSGSQYQDNYYTDGVTALEDGGFVAVWKSNNQDGSGSGVYGQRYAANGTTVGGEFRVNVTTSGNQLSPSVAGLKDGGFIATWTADTPSDGSGYAVFARRYDAGGNPVSGEFQVNATTASYQYFSTATGLADGGFALGWMSLGQDGNGMGSYLRRYAADGSPLSGEIQLNQYTSSDQFMPQLGMREDGGLVATWMSYQQDGSGWGVYARIITGAGAALAVNEDTPLAISGVSVADIDAGAAGVALTLSAAHGTLNVATNVAGGVDVSAVSGNGTDTVIVTGTAAAINTTLAASAGLSYQGLANFNGADTLSATVSDLGHTGIGGALADTKTVDITVRPVSDTYVLSNLIVNGSFEQQIGTGYLWGGSTAMPGWTVTGTDVDRVSGWQAGDSSYSLDLNGFNPGGVQQSLATVPGVQYTVGFDLSKNPGNSSTATVQVSAAGDSQSYTFNAMNTTTDMKWSQQTFTFTATDTTTTLSFTSTYPTSGLPGDLSAEGPALDEVVVVSNKVIDNFTKGAGGDVLNLHDLLTSVNAPHDSTAFSGGFLRFFDSNGAAAGGDTLVQVDSNGGGDSFLTLATLSNQLLAQADSANYLL
ncbi:MAG: choice-of-anchor C family protein [Pseudomonadota bacterium]